MAAEDQEPRPACILSIELNPGGTGARAAAVEASEADADGVETDAEDKEAEPTEIDAGAEVTLVGTIACSPPRDLRELTILVRDQDGSQLGEAEIVEFDGEINTTAELTVKAPLQPGDYTWLAVLPAHAADEVEYEEVASPVPLTVKAHTTSIAVWDVPTAIVAGETFRFKIGVKCSSACRPTGWTFEVSNEHGEQVATGTLEDEPWPDTAALFYAEVEARAPKAEGLHDWTVRAPGPGLDVPHEQQTARVGVRSVPQPECLVTVEAIDFESQAPLKDAKVVIHPYRAVTDDQGRAQLRVPKGTYRVFVSASGHVPYRTDGEVMADTTIRAELLLYKVFTEADLWA
jgi:hypothetical protein